MRSLRAGFAFAALALAAAAAARAEIVVSNEQARAQTTENGTGAAPALYRGGSRYAPLAPYPPSYGSVQPPTLWRAPNAPLYPAYSAWPAYGPFIDPRGAQAMNAYALQRAHRFSQNRYSENAAPLPPLSFFFGSPWLLPNLVTVIYPQNGINAPLRRDNQEMTRYHIDRAHLFSQDAYRGK